MKEKMDAILSALPWRCFHCDFVTNDPVEAQSHFGDVDDASEFSPTCKWWSSMDDDERKHTFQDIQKELTAEQDENGNLRRHIEDMEDRLGAQESAMQSYKPFKKCHSMHEVFCLYDSMEGRALAAEERERILVELINDAGFQIMITDDGKTFIKPSVYQVGIPAGNLKEVL